RWRAEMASSNVRYRLFKHPIAAGLERWRVQRPLRYAFSAMLVSTSLQVGSAPLMVIYFHRLSFAALFLNIFSFGVIVSLVCVAFAAVTIFNFIPSLGAALIAIAEKISWLMTHLVGPFAHFGIASMRLPHYSGRLAAIYTLYYLPLGFLVMALARWNP